MSENKYTTEDEIKLLRQEIKAAKLNELSPLKKYTIFKLVGVSIFLVVLMVLVSILISVMFSKISGETPQLFGYQLYRVMSGSMSPSFKVGTVILSKIPKDKSALKVGDIVTFKSNNVIITHRIIEVINVERVLYKTKGDNPNNSPDADLLDPAQVKAVFVVKLY